ncbi:MAG: 5'/3'-nucleotidase SurE [Nitrospiraceae bacterium]|nr:MAG: 5'/3'-nucleotidase SurE [Nitrospiraceae bacterium]
MPMILVTNDDGISSPGLKILAKRLKSAGDVYVVAPETEQSAVAHALTLHRPLRAQRVRNNTFHVNGTPTDCVIIAVSKLLPQRPDLIVSGINFGANLGDDITYSGTVAAAMEGTLLGIPSIAISLIRDDRESSSSRKNMLRFRGAADFASSIVQKVLKKGLPEDTLLNVNVPNTADIRGVKFTRQGKLVYDNPVHERVDPRGRKYYWISGGVPRWETGEDTDFDAIHKGYISVTPVHLDLTDFGTLERMKKNWKVRERGVT